MTTPAIRRAFIDVAGRQVHYRSAGAGTPILMVHQSPKSSAEFAALMASWSTQHLVIAPDTPGFGQSEPLADPDATVSDFADALVAFMDAVGLGRVPVYGYHSGAVFAVEAARRHPARFTAVACNAYAVWTREEIAQFASGYLPPFVPDGYGAHLTWLWARMREQRFFFPWYATDDAHRMALPLATPAYVHENAMDMLHAGDAYRVGYGAVVRAARDLPADDQAVPTLILAADTDPLQSHITRLGRLPPNWRAGCVPSVADVEAQSLQFLQQHQAPPAMLAPVQGFLDYGDCQIRMRRTGRDITCVVLHDIGSSSALLTLGPGEAAPDLPGHGLTSVPATDWASTVRQMTHVVSCVAAEPVRLRAHGFSAGLALAVAGFRPDLISHVDIRDGLWPAKPLRPAIKQRQFTDLTPDDYGDHLTHAWRRVRDAALFWPWFDNRPEAALPVDPGRLTPAALARAHLAALQAHGAQTLLEMTVDQPIGAIYALCPVPVTWTAPGWASARTDIWKPPQETR